jgi:hypothetical protein
MERLIAVLMLLLPGAALAAGKAPYYFIAVQNGAYNFKGGEAQMAESYKALQAMVKLAAGQNVRLTLLFSAQYALYIATDPARMAELESWKDAGHEVGAYHQGPDTRAWDGYSDLEGKELARVRKDGGAGPAPGHAEYFAALARLEPDVKTGCVTDRRDKKFLAAAPPYEICGGAPGPSGVNDFILVAGSSTERKELSSFHAGDKAGIEAAENTFSGMTGGVYGVSFRSSPSEFGAFYAWLAFLRREDPQGARSRTVTTTVNGDILKETAQVPAPARRKERRVVMALPARQSEPSRQEIPRLRLVPSFYGTVGRVMLGRKAFRNLNRAGYCGDGICDAVERANPGRCPQDCGR